MEAFVGRYIRVIWSQGTPHHQWKMCTCCTLFHHLQPLVNEGIFKVQKYHTNLGGIWTKFPSKVRINSLNRGEDLLRVPFAIRGFKLDTLLPVLDVCCTWGGNFLVFFISIYFWLSLVGCWFQSVGFVGEATFEIAHHPDMGMLSS